MKVATSFRIRSGPWGGGNRFLAAMVNALESRGDSVFTTLADPDIDLILLMDPRWRHPSSTFTAGAILRYLLRNPRTVVVHRINECDERKNTRGMNWRLRLANYCADHTVFVGEWLRRLDLWQDRGAPYSIIRNGADTAVFNRDGWVPWDHSGPLRIVTHHWGGNWMKGFDIYRRLDEMLADQKWCQRIAFTYVGNLPEGFRFRNARHVPPLDGIELAAELRSHHAYVTASINEPGGNHQNEGALCGLPLLYRNSGCLPEYCEGFGVRFDEKDFETALEALMDGYDDFVAAMPAYPHTAQHMAAEYLDLFDRLLNTRDQIVAQRRIWRNPALLIRNQLPI